MCTDIDHADGSVMRYCAGDAAACDGQRRRFGGDPDVTKVGECRHPGSNEYSIAASPGIAAPIGIVLTPPKAHDGGSGSGRDR